MEQRYFDRDISWLSFNERVLREAARPELPLLERLNFLAIFSSNLDEFYRVRVPSLLALHKIRKTRHHSQAGETLEKANELIKAQQRFFGEVLAGEVVPGLGKHQIRLVYGEAIPENIRGACRDYFFSHLLAYLQPVDLSKKSFFPENNHIYFAAELCSDSGKRVCIVNIPSVHLSRFFSIGVQGVHHIVFIDDIIREHLHLLFPGEAISGAFSFKITRDAELDLKDEYGGDIAAKIEKQIARRDLGIATRFLYSPGMSAGLLESLRDRFNLASASMVAGGAYHHLRDLAQLPVRPPQLCYPPWPPVSKRLLAGQSLFNSMALGDFMVHPPYHDYNLILRFFNEASIDPDVNEIYVTLYRIAADSRIGAALISAARNGKTVTVFVELKARFDEANNIRWSKRLKEAGVRIIYSFPGLKVHAKVALVKRKKDNRVRYFGLLATGNFNESTARVYTDHILFTANKEILRELELLFLVLAKRKRPDSGEIAFQHLLVSQFNLQPRFLALIDREIEHAKNGRRASITIKLNNIEESVLIDKLYEASAAGVKIRILARSICRLIPGVPGLSEQITVTRIVDRFLEHGRIWWFHNNGADEFYAGSADWMNRNIYRRIEVCFPVTEPAIRGELRTLLELQLKDNDRAVTLDASLNNNPVTGGSNPLRSQEAIYQYLSNHE